MEKHKKQRALESDKMENQLRQYTAKNQIAESELQYPLPVCVWIKLFLHRTCKIAGSGTTECRTGHFDQVLANTDTCMLQGDLASIIGRNLDVFWTPLLSKLKEFPKIPICLLSCVSQLTEYSKKTTFRPCFFFSLHFLQILASFLCEFTACCIQSEKWSA